MALKARPERRALEQRALSAEDRADASRASARPHCRRRRRLRLRAARTRGSFREAGLEDVLGRLGRTSPGRCGTAAVARAEQGEAAAPRRGRCTRASATSTVRSPSRSASGTLELDSSRAALDRRRGRGPRRDGGRRVVGERFAAGVATQHRRARRAGRAAAGASSIARAPSRSCDLAEAQLHRALGR